jgi:hypothetical protein
MLFRRFLSFVLLLRLALAAGHEAKHALNNDDIIKMVRDGFDENVIVALIDSDLPKNLMSRSLA